MIANKENWFKRSLSLLLAIVMCMGMINVTAFAVESEDLDNTVKWSVLYGNKGTNSMAATCDSINDVKMLSDNSYIAVGAFDGNGVSDIEGQKEKPMPH